MYSKNLNLPDRESNPGLPRDRRGYWPLYYRGFRDDFKECNPNLDWQLTLISGPVRFPSNFRCYEGIQNTGMNSSCDNHCRYGIDCMCIKIDNVPGKMNDSCGTARAVLNQDTTGSFFSFSWPCVSQVTAQCEAAGRILTQHWLPDAWLITSGYEHYNNPTTLKYFISKK